MKKICSKFLSLSVLLMTVAASAPFARAQTTEVRVLSNPAGPQFQVDGTNYGGPVSFLWPVGSQHTLYAPSGSGYAYNIGQTIQWQFAGWQWSGGTQTQNPLPISASTAIPQYTALYNALYQFSLSISCSPGLCTGNPGTVTLNGIAVSGNQTSWQGLGATLALQAFPNPGWTFAGWAPAANQTITGFQDIVTMNAPTAVNAVFVQATTVNVVTVPNGLPVYADHTLVSTPVSLSWAQGSQHWLAPSGDWESDVSGKRWSFVSWSNGGAENQSYVVPNSGTSQTITATFTPSAYPQFLTSPQTNLNLVVDGLVLPPPYSYIWGVGSTHTVSATTPQTDAQGNSWIFKSWDDLATTPSRTITIPVGADVNGYTLHALFTEQATLTVGSTIAGLSVTVDGTACTTPCTVQRSLGASVHVSAPGSVPLGAGFRQDFLGWSSGGGAPVAGDWIATLNVPSTSIVASYHLMNLLTTAANPSGGATWTIQPASPDGYYDSQTAVSLGVTAQPGFRFANWTGDLSGSVPTASLTMSVPHSVMAQFTKVPFISPNGVTNAAGALPQTGVAPGSVVSIFGASLASTTAVGPATPMVQTLAGLTASVGTRLLPLYFASPTQINLQIPSDLALGQQTVTVSSLGMPDVNSTFTIVRDAPGIFGLLLDGQNYALALHEDGSLVTPQFPAQKGELLTAYATGFGPTAPVRPNGYAVPATPAYQLLDPITLQVGSVQYTPQNAFAAPGQVGLDLVQFRLDSSAPSGSTIAVYFTVNGVNSNTLNLPIQ